MRRALSLLFAIATAAAVSCGGDDADPTDATPHGTAITGTFTLYSTDLDIEPAEDGSGCHGTGGFSDITQGMEIVVRDQDRTVIATTALGAGYFPDDLASTYPDVLGDIDTDVLERALCAFDFVAEDLPYAEFYELEGGTRGTETFSREDLEEMGWEVQMQIGL